MAIGAEGSPPIMLACPGSLLRSLSAAIGLRDLAAKPNRLAPPCLCRGAGWHRLRGQYRV